MTTKHLNINYNIVIGMGKIKFSGAKVYKVGDSHVITVPSTFIKNGQVQPGKCYDVEMEESRGGVDQ